MAKTRQVALLFPMGQRHHAHRLQGITDYARHVGNWTLSVNPEPFNVSIESLAGWRGSGAIVLVRTARDLQMARAKGIPVVNISGVLRQGGLPRVLVDDLAIGRLAAEHLLECGFRRFAYYGIANAWFAAQRGQSFVERVEQVGGVCSVLEAPLNFDARNPWHRGRKTLEKWLSTLEPPVGLLAVHDYRASVVIDACIHLGLRVPEDVAVIGVCNEEAICELCQIPLTSIPIAGREVGYQAAALLDRLMLGEAPPRDEILLPPTRPVKRRSTDMITAEDAHVAAAARFVREHMDQVPDVAALERVVPVSRRVLERRFRKFFHCTPHQYLCRRRVDRAKQLLDGADNLPLWKIAEACGFTETRHLRLVFHRLTGITPTEYRRAQRK